MDIKKAKRKYTFHKSCAKRRGIPFNFTFEEWCYEWRYHFDDRGRNAWKYGMCRINDAGAYEPGNVYIARPKRNGASRRMALENRKGKQSRHCFFADLSDEPSDENLGYATSNFWA